MAIQATDLRDTTQLLTKAFRTPVVAVFAVLCGIEAILVLGLPGMGAEVVGAMLADPIHGIFNVANVEVVGVVALVLLLFAIDLLRQGLWGPLRRVVLDDIAMTPGEIVKEAAGRMVPLFVTQQLIGIFVFLISAIGFLLGLSLLTIPHALVTFTLAPALYLVAAHDRSIPGALGDAMKITRRNLIAVFGVQGALLALAYWIGEFLQQAAASWAVTPLVAAWAAAGLLATYRFVRFAGMATLFLTLDRCEELSE